MRENDPERYKEMLQRKYDCINSKFRAARALVAEADAAGGARLQDPDVVAARAYVEHVRTQRRTHFKEYYNSNPDFRVRHREKVAVYDRAKAAAKREAKNASQVAA